MKCPICTNVDLLLAERQGVEIDYCPTCRGVWLDRGELDKVIERASAQSAEQPSAGKESYYRPQQQPAYQMKHGQTFHQDHKGHGYGHGQHYKKKKSLLSEIFDFD